MSAEPDQHTGQKKMGELVLGWSCKQAPMEGSILNLGRGDIRSEDSERSSLAIPITATKNLNSGGERVSGIEVARSENEPISNV